MTHGKEYLQMKMKGLNGEATPQLLGRNSSPPHPSPFFFLLLLWFDLFVWFVFFICLLNVVFFGEEVAR